MEIGISTYTYTWAVGVPGYPTAENPMGALGLLEKAKEFDIRLVQICDNYPLHMKSREELDAIRRRAHDWGIKIEVGTRGVEPEHLLQYLDIVEFFGGNLLRIILQKNGGPVDISEATELIKKALPEFESKKVAIAVENHERHRVDQLVDLVKRIDSPFLGICLDTVNSFGALEGPKYVIETLAPFTINLHIKDFKIERLDHKMGFQITGNPAGSGQLDMEFLLNKLKKYNRKPNAILELWTPYSGSIEATIAKEREWAVQSIKYLKECLK